MPDTDLADAATEPAPTTDPAPGSVDERVLDWAVIAARAAASKTDEDTVVIDVTPVLAEAGYFVITSGRNDRQVKTIAEEVEAQLKEAGGPKPLRTEGLDTRQWVLLDFGDVVVHVFADEARRFYDLERLWADRPRVDWTRIAEG